jgi:hypothetical protein
MMPDAIMLLFKEARDAFPPFEGKPTDDDLLSIRERLLSILMEIPYNQLGGPFSHKPPHGFCKVAANHGTTFVRPVCLPLYNGTIANDATTVIRIHA